MKNSRKKMKNSNNILSSYGILFNGTDPGSRTGWSVSDVGDVNQDGIDDFVIGGPGVSPYGAVYLIYGYNSTTPPYSPFPLSEIGTPLNTAGVLFNGTYASRGYEGTGWSVSAAGDVNADGIPDILIGSPYLTWTKSYIFSGAAYVIYGRNLTNPFPPVFSLDDLMSNNTDGVTFLGNEYEGNAGLSVSGIGDVNGDKISDFLIGEPAAMGSGNAGTASLLYGRSLTDPFPSPFYLSSLGNATGITDGVVFRNKCSVQHNFQDLTGFSVSSAGDVNHDGINDFLIGAPWWNYCGNSTVGPGAAYLLYGRAPTNPFPPLFDLNSLGESGNQSGVILIGPNHNSATGLSVSKAGDVDQDGIDDFLIGAPVYNQGWGTTYLLYGRTSINPFPPSFSLSNLGSPNNTEGVVFNTYQPAYVGHSVSGVGDVNQDGIDDFLIGAPSTNFPGAVNGSAYLVFGRNAVNPFPPVFSLDSLTQKITLPAPAFSNSEGVVFLGGYGDYLGHSVSRAGDINHDGIPDFLISAPSADYTINYDGGHLVGPGQAFLIYGQSQQQNAETNYQDVEYIPNDRSITLPPMSDRSMRLPHSLEDKSLSSAPRNRKLLSLSSSKQANILSIETKPTPFSLNGITVGLTQSAIGLFSAASTLLLPGINENKRTAAPMHEGSQFDLNIPAAFMVGLLAFGLVFSLLFYVVSRCDRETKEEQADPRKPFSI